MSNTLKFGNGEWYGKEGTILAYNDENNNYKPLPFDFSRASSATRVNKDGLIETVGSGEPRVDYLNDSNGALKLEPTRSNIAPYSNDFNQHSILGGSITSDNITSPDGGVNSDTFVENTANSQHRIREDISVTAGTYTMSVFIKGTDRFISLYPQSAGSAYAVFDIENAAVTKTGGSDYVDSKIENYGNGWYRCILTYNVSSGTSFLHIYLSDKGTGTAAEAPTYIGDGSEMSFYGLQLEQGSYATSYIPTSGSAVTRVIDDIELFFPSSSSFSSTSGFTSLIEFGVGGRSGSASSPFIFINDTDATTYMAYGSSGANWRCRLNISGTAYLNTATNASRDNVAKLAISSDSNGWSQCANGVVYASGVQDASALNVLSSITFNTSDLYGQIKIRSLKIYNTRLSDSELESLTSL